METVLDTAGSASPDVVVATAGLGATVTTNDDSVLPGIPATEATLITNAGSAFGAMDALDPIDPTGAFPLSLVLTRDEPCQ